jgi:N-methylhydantoinase A
VREAITEHVAKPLALNLVDAAFGIYRLVNANMANAIRRISALRGVDPRGLTMVAYGGNGPVHATAQADELGINTVLVPKTAPAFSAFGLLLSDQLIDEMRAYITPVRRADLARINALLAEMEQAARQTLAERRGTHRRVDVQRFANLCYPGQTFDMAVPLAARNGRLDEKALAKTVERFHQLHEELHTYASRDEEPILRSVRLTVVGVTDKPKLPACGRATTRAPLKARRKAFFGGRFVETPVYDGAAMRAGHRVKGPAIIEEPLTTIVLHPRQLATLDRYGNYRIELR